MTNPTRPAPDPDAEKVCDILLSILAAANVPIGTAYLKGSAQGVPAVTVRDWPEGTRVTGLEVIVPANPKLFSIPGFEFMGYWRTWPIRFINRDGKSDILEKAANAIGDALWPLDDEPVLLEPVPSQGRPEQMVIGVNVDQRDKES